MPALPVVTPAGVVLKSSGPAAAPRVDHAGPALAAERVELLDVLRGLMALAVAVYHLSIWTHAVQGAARNGIVLLGIYSVEGFFVISGFCMFHLYRGARFEPRSFYIKRFFRIAPLYYVAMTVALSGVCAHAGIPSTAFTWPRLIGNLTLSFGLFHPNHALVLGGWSIGIEFVFYLILPLLLWLTKRWAILYLLLVLAIGCAIPFSFGRIQAAEEARRFHVYVLIPNQVFLFLAGAAIADLRSRTSWRLPLLQVLGTLGVMLWLAASTQPPFSDHLDVMVGWARVKYVLLCVFAVASCAFCARTRPRFVQPLTRLGDLSYSVYLMHPAAWAAVALLLPPATSSMTRLICGVVATLGLASVTQRFIEKPAIACGRNLCKKLGARPRLVSTGAVPSQTSAERGVAFTLR